MSQATRESEGLTLLGNQRTQYAQDYDPSLLETFENKHPEHDYMVTFRCPSSPPYVPSRANPILPRSTLITCPTSAWSRARVLKLYLFSFRNHGDFHEDVVNVIMRDLVELMDPKYIEVRGMFYPRGGISIYPFANWGASGCGLRADCRRAHVRPALGFRLGRWGARIAPLASTVAPRQPALRSLRLAPWTSARGAIRAWVKALLRISPDGLLRGPYGSLPWTSPPVRTTVSPHRVRCCAIMAAVVANPPRGRRGCSQHPAIKKN